MSDHTADFPDQVQRGFFDEESTRSLLDQLLADSRMYRKSKDFKDLLDFVVRLRGFAPFNAMLLQVQKPGLSYAASERDWFIRFRRQPKEGARPLLILWPFGPVAFVYDVVDTEGEALPEDVASFAATGSIKLEQFESFENALRRKRILMIAVDAGDNNAGLVRVVHRATDKADKSTYQISLNRNHDAQVRFSTLAHELGHLFLGHLGADRALKVPQRPRLSHAQQEIEAESVAFIVCKRNGVNPKSQTYLSGFVEAESTSNDLDIYQVMRAAGQVETALNLGARTKFTNV